MYGAVIGDIIGSVYEQHNVKTEDFALFSTDTHFTDDTVLSAAVAAKLLADREGRGVLSARKSYGLWYKQYYRRYPNAGFGQLFAEWASSDSLRIQRSYGNGGAMRVTPIGYVYDTIEETLKEAEASCYYTHHHQEAAACAKAVALAVFLARNGCDKDEIKKSVVKHTKLHLNFTLDEIRDTYVFDSRAQNSVPQAIVAFLESGDYESAVRKAVSIGGDSDTIACMAGGIAEAYYRQIPADMLSAAKRFLDSGLKDVMERFCEAYCR